MARRLRGSGGGPSSTRAMASSIAGLHIIRAFVGEAEARALLSGASRLSQRATEASVSIAQPAVTSTAHNVNSQERFHSLALALDSDGGTAQCEHFADYAEGHALTYFRGKIPTLGAAPSLPSRLAALPTVRDELARSRQRLNRPNSGPLKWKMTLNRYASTAGSPRVGFPWHRDLANNGAASMILSLGGTGELEFGVEPPDAEEPVDGIRYSSDHTMTATQEVPVVEHVSLRDGDLLVLTGPARWEYLHRVCPSRSSTDERVSLVFGVW